MKELCSVCGKNATDGVEVFTIDEDPVSTILYLCPEHIENIENEIERLLNLAAKREVAPR